jgi:hypothetical protein
MASASVRPPTAEGRLEKTPMVHLLVYMADRRLTGSISFAPPISNGPVEDVIHFFEGAPAKIRTGRPIAHLGEVLVDLGSLTEEVRRSSLDAASKAGELHGEFLVRTGAIGRPALFAGLHAQAKRKAAHIFAAPGETAFSFFEGENLLEDWGGPELCPLDPLDQVWLAARARHDAHIIDATLARLGSTLLRLHEASPVDRFGFGRQEFQVVKRIRAAPATLVDVIASQVAPEPIVRLVVYVLLVTRHLDHGPTVRPVAVDWVSNSVYPDPTAPTKSNVPIAQANATPQAVTPTVGGVSPDRPRPLSPDLTARRHAILQRADEIDTEDFFQTLGVARDATDRVIQSAFLAFVKIWHTDRLPPELDDVRDAASKVFARTNTAFETLSKPERRKQYLETLAGGGAAAETEDEQVEKILDAATQFQHAEVFFKKHDLVNADLCCARACELDGGQADYLALHVAIQLQKRTLDAPVDDLIPLLDAALEKNDKCELAYFTRATLRKRIGQIDLAMDDYRIAFELNPGNLDAAREVRVYEMRKSRQPGGRGSSGPPNKTPSNSPVRRLSGFLASLPARLSSSMPAVMPSSSPARGPSSSPARGPSSSPARGPSSSPAKRDSNPSSSPTKRKG